MSKDKQFVFGHQNPDTDAIASAISYSYLENKRGENTEAVALGKPNDETQFALDYFGVKAPRVIKSALPEVNKVMLVDHNESQQSVSDIDKVTVTHVVDHHRVNFSKPQPMYYTAKPWGCCCSIIKSLFDKYGVEVPKKIAGMMMSAIISDTLLLKSPTTTPFDKKIIKDLAKIAGVDDIHAYGIKELKAGTNVDDKDAKTLIDTDAKSYTLGGKSIRIAQINVVDLNDITKRKAEVKQAMADENKSEGYDLFLGMVTDVLNSDSDLIAVGDPKLAVEQAFNGKLDADGMMKAPGVVSRKKQVVPPLTKALGKK
ncbi:putative manganese-dependent inorganic pyrophosphatase [Philodulcilactobacillus myokoensis]|uniref:inorganic diphosphatase n=1 Tax=Philodulcilactobacillus myokoensis TaxID=2929573 RepID=A0A9W6B142_9LACO|nr:manganese-dependent inorganic pyrophosphatase [Philodulcilactobacillus myokoensis]GLB46856.1 putative manganese-dependent inorganic pyrophosphatase [Philodulcilactobacillus myokoensis]